MLDLLVCPRCRGDLASVETGEEPAALVCAACRLAYPVVDGVPWMLEALARRSH